MLFIALLSIFFHGSYTSDDWRMTVNGSTYSRRALKVLISFKHRARFHAPLYSFNHVVETSLAWIHLSAIPAFVDMKITVFITGSSKIAFKHKLSWRPCSLVLSSWRLRVLILTLRRLCFRGGGLSRAQPLVLQFLARPRGCYSSNWNLEPACAVLWGDWC